MHLSLVVFLGLLAAATASKSYSGYSVIRVFPENDVHLEYLAKLRDNSHFDFWTEVRRDFVDIMVSPVQSYVMKAQLALRGMKSETFIPDVQALIEEAGQHVATKEARAMDWTSYHRMADIHAWMDELAEANPSWISTEVIGQSSLGKDLKVLKLNSANAEKKIWLDGGIHAREWISPATVTYIVNELVNNYEANKELVDTFQWYILPVHNPDGYEYAHTDERLWRKTLTDHDSFWGCLGADPNRNWDYQWMVVGASSDKCSEIYAGPEALSEPCCGLVADYVAELNADHSFLAYYTFHSYSQLWLSPWGWTSALPDNYSDLERVMKAGSEALTAVYGTDYEYGSSTNVLYAASGASDDYAYAVLEVPYVYTVELRDQGRYGFVLPADQIVPSGIETFAGFKAAVAEMLK